MRHFLSNRPRGRARGDLSEVLRRPCVEGLVPFVHVIILGARARLGALARPGVARPGRLWPFGRILQNRKKLAWLAHDCLGAGARVCDKAKIANRLRRAARRWMMHPALTDSCYPLLP